MTRQFEQNNIVAGIMGGVRPATRPKTTPAPMQKTSSRAPEKEPSKLRESEGSDDLRTQTVTVARDVYTWLLWQVADGMSRGEHISQSAVVERALCELRAHPDDSAARPGPARKTGDYVSRTFQLTAETWSWLHDEHIRRLAAGEANRSMSAIIDSALRVQMDGGA